MFLNLTFVMPNPMKIQPVNSISDSETVPEPVRADPVFKSLIKKLFDRSALKNLSTEKSITVSSAKQLSNEAAIRGGGGELEPSSVCLEKMVHNFIEEINEKPQNNNRCNCFNTKINDSSDDDEAADVDSISLSSTIDFTDFLKGLINCGSVAEKNLLAETLRIVEKNKLMKRKGDLRFIVVKGLLSAGYDASVCKSRWDKTPGYPAGEHVYIDVVVDGERVIIDVDFRSEFEIARSTGSYKAILQLVPYIFVGKVDRLQQIVSVVCEAARQSLKKKGMPFPPWRKAEYMKCKWLAGYNKARKSKEDEEIKVCDYVDYDEGKVDSENEHGELELIFGRVEEEEEVEKRASAAMVVTGELEVMKPATTAWHPPPVKPKSCERSRKGVVTGLSFLLREKS